MAKFHGNLLYLIPGSGGTEMVAQLGLEPNQHALVGALVMSKFIPVDSTKK